MRALVAALLSATLLAAASVTIAQVNMQLSGTVASVEGQTLILITKGPPPRRVTFGVAPSPAPAAPPTLTVDLDEVPASQYMFLQPGERIAVVGVPSADGTRFAAIRIIGGAGPRRAPEAP